MARKPKGAGAFDGILSPAEHPTHSHELIRSFVDPSTIPPGVAIDWIANNARAVECAGAECWARRDEAASSEPNDKRTAETILANARDFVRMADLSMPILCNDDGSNLTEAFLVGMRLGMAYERLHSVADGRYKAIWARECGLKKAAEGKQSKRSSDRDATLEAMEAVKRRRPDRAHDIDFVKEKAAADLGITKRGLNKRLAQ